MKKSSLILITLLTSAFGLLSAKGEQIETNWQPYVLYKPDPFMPAVALRKGWGGIMRVHLTINPKTGQVDEVKVLRHTGYPTLDAEMVLTFFNCVSSREP